MIDFGFTWCCVGSKLSQPESMPLLPLVLLALCSVLPTKPPDFQGWESFGALLSLEAILLPSHALLFLASQTLGRLADTPTAGVPRSSLFANSRDKVTRGCGNI